MKVLLLLTEAFSNVGGIQTYNRCLIRAFDELSVNHDIEVTALILNDFKKDFGKCHFSKNVKLIGFGRNKVSFLINSLLLILGSDLILIGHVNFLPLIILFIWTFIITFKIRS